MIKKISDYIVNSYSEITKEVTWPTLLTLQQSTMIVISTTLLITLIVWLMDTGAASLLKAAYSVIK